MQRTTRGSLRQVTLKIALLFDLIPKQRIARPSASTSACYRPLLMCTSLASCCACQRLGCKTRVAESFEVWDAGVLPQLPLFVQDSLPFLLTRKSAIHRDLIAEGSDNVVDSKSIAASAEALAQAHLKYFHDAELRYYNMLLWSRKTALSQATTESGFGCFDDSGGCNVFFPSANYLTTVWCEWTQRAPVAKIDKCVEGVEGEVCCCVLELKNLLYERHIEVKLRDHSGEA